MKPYLRALLRVLGALSAGAWLCWVAPASLQPLVILGVLAGLTALLWHEQDRLALEAGHRHLMAVASARAARLPPELPCEVVVRRDGMRRPYLHLTIGEMALDFALIKLVTPRSANAIGSERYTGDAEFDEQIRVCLSLGPALARLDAGTRARILRCARFPGFSLLRGELRASAPLPLVFTTSVQQELALLEELAAVAHALRADRFQTPIALERALLETARGDPEPQVRLQALAELIRTSAVPAILEQALALAAPTADSRLTVARMIAGVEPPDPDTLASILVDEASSWRVRADALELVEAGSQAMESALLQLVETESLWAGTKALALLGRVGTLRSVQALQPLYRDKLLISGRAARARAAVRAIQARLLDAGAGAISEVAPTDQGALSLDPQTGELTLLQE